jgi:putative flippase GtrA
LKEQRQNLEPGPGAKEALLGVGRGSLARNAIAGAVATLADFALVSALVSWGRVSPPVATLWGCGFGGIVNFSVNRGWAFESSLPMRRSMVRYALVSASSALLNAGGVAGMLAVSKLIYPAPYQVVWWLVRGLVYAFFNYPLQREYVFVHRSR